MRKTPLIGPHEGIELMLMKAGEKPAAMFTVPFGSSAVDLFPEDEFDEMVAAGQLTKFVRDECIDRGVCTDGVRRIIYTLKGEDWRIRAILLFVDRYSSEGSGWHLQWDQAIGALLGYSRDQIDAFVERILSQKRCDGELS